MDGCRLNPGRDRHFSHHYIQSFPGPTKPLMGTRRCFPLFIMQPEHEADHSPLILLISESMELSSVPLYAFMARCLGIGTMVHFIYQIY